MQTMFVAFNVVSVGYIHSLVLGSRIGKPRWNTVSFLPFFIVGLYSSTLFAQSAPGSPAVPGAGVLRQDTSGIDVPDLTKEYLERTRSDTPTPQTADIPSEDVRAEGGVIQVKAFKFHRLTEYPEAGIYRATIESMAEDLRKKYMQEDELIALGYTKQELVEVASHLKRLGHQINEEDLKENDLVAFVELVQEQEQQRGISYAELEEVTDELTRFYRRQGLFLAQVQIPVQDVEDGIVYLTVQEGLLGGTKVENSQRYSARLLQKPFKPQFGKLVDSANIEEGLYLLNDLPGLNVSSYFSAGENPGETQLNLQVKGEDRFRLSARMDNHGSLFTGDKRLYLIGNLYNPLGLGDELTLGYLNSFSPENSKLGQLEYRLPVAGPRTWVTLNADYNDFSLSDEENPQNAINGLEIEGVNRTLSLSVEHKYIRSRDFNITFGGGLTDKKSDLSASIVLQQPGDHTQGAELNFTLDTLGKGIKMLNVVNMNVYYGGYVDDETEGSEAKDDFSIFTLNTNSLFFMPLPFSDKTARFIFNSRWQYSDQPLPSFEQFSLGGANAVRAFTVRDFSSDQGVFLTAEFLPDLPNVLNPNLWGDYQLNDLLDIGLFVDGAYGVVHGTSNNILEETPGDDWAHLGGAGLVVKFAVPSLFSSKISFARPFSADSSLEGIGDDAKSVNTYFDFTFYY